MIGPDIGLDLEYCSCDTATTGEREFICTDPPCCAECPHCRRRVKSECFEDHTRRHEKETSSVLKHLVRVPLPY